VPGEVGELLAQSARRDALEAVHQPGLGDLGWEVDHQVYVVGLAVELDQLVLDVSQTARMICSMRARCRGSEDAVSVLRHEHQVGVEQERAVPTRCLPGRRPFLSVRDPTVLVCSSGTATA
jgi:hypothetical protein